MSVLLVDGDNLLTIGFYGVKNYFYKGEHIGGIYHVLNTLRKSFELYHLDKIVVFWDGQNGSHERRKLYTQYKENRRERIRSEEELNSYSYQRNRVKQYLEELFVRQGEFEYCETDDCIAYYTQNSEEEIIIYSSDGDLTQLVNKNVKIYNPSHQRLYQENDTIKYNHEEILIENVKLVKMFCGDSSDNIAGIKGMGVKRFLTLFPEAKLNKLSVQDIRQKTNDLFEQDKHNKTLANLLTGVTKYGVFGDEFYDINEKIVSLETPFLTEDAKEVIKLLISESLDPEGRSYKNVMRMMMTDGIMQVLPKSDDGLNKFLNPFLRLTRKEKNKTTIKTKTIKVKENE
jgi:5'-3' exonuclease